MANELVKISMKNYLSSPAINKFVDEMLGERKGTFIATLTSLVNGNEKLKDCDKSTILMAALKSVGMNLPIDPSLGKAYVIPYGDQAQFQLGYRGLLELALRSGQYELIGAKEVKEKEFKGYNFVGDPIIEWLSPSERFDLKTIGYMAGFQLSTGFKKMSFWSNEEIDKHANTYSKAYQNFKKYGPSKSTAKSGNLTNPWESNFSDMAQKTVLKNLIGKYGVLSIEMQQALKYDQAVISIDSNMQEEIKYLDNPTSIELDSDRISKQQQELILQNYSQDVIKEALYNSSIDDITQIETDAFDGFVVLCKAINEEQKKLSQ
jgi:recombination protein RecT